MDLELQGRTAIVTGGTRNLGRAIAEALLSEGANVVTTYRSDISAAKAFLKATAPPLRERLKVLQLDVSEANNCEAVVQSAVAEFGGLDVLVNNAGVMSREGVNQISNASFDWMMHNTLRSVVYMSRAAFKVMGETGGGRIVNLSSEAVHTGNPAELSYLTSKAGVEGATRAFARMGGPKGVTVNAVAAHVVSNGMGQETLSRDPTIASRIPLGRSGRQRECVSLVLFLCSGACQYLNGQTLHLNGGRIMHG